MKTKLPSALINSGSLLLLLATLNSQLSTLFAQGTAFTYQGRLNSSGTPASGSYDFRFRLAVDALGNTYAGSAVLTGGVAVADGLFITTIDFGTGLFTGSNYWLQVDVKTNGAAGYTTLTPLQAVTPAPYAIFAGTASNLSGALAAGQLSGTIALAQLPASVVTNNASGLILSGAFTGNGAGLTNVNAATLGGLGSSNFWRTGGNAGTMPGANFFGTTDNQSLDLKVNGQRALRIEPTANADTVNVIGGSSLNSVGAGVVGATIGGGGSADYAVIPWTNRVDADFGTVSGGAANTIGANAFYATIGGGHNNTIQALAVDSTISGGTINLIQPNASEATIGGGSDNTVQNNADGATIGGGHVNTIQTNAAYATVGGGDQNRIQINGVYATIPGGQLNSATNYAFAAGRRAKANRTGAFVWADSTDADFAATASDQFLIRASGGVGIGKSNPASALDVNGTVTASNFSGSGAGLTGLNAANLTGAVPPASLTSVPAASLSGIVADARLSANVGLLTGSQTFTGAKTFSSLIVAPSGVRVDRTNVWFTGDQNHGVGYFGAGRTFAGSAPDGPVLFGFGGGALGTEQFGSEHIALSWNTTSVSVFGTFNNNSDRNAKERISVVSPTAILDKVSRLPVAEWSYKTDAATRHIGPMAQDFYAAFHIGTDERHIAPIDEGGVALAAIRGLNEKVESGSRKSDVRIQKLEAENAELKRELGELKQAMKSIAHKLNGGVQ